MAPPGAGAPEGGDAPWEAARSSDGNHNLEQGDTGGGEGEAGAGSSSIHGAQLHESGGCVWTGPTVVLGATSSDVSSDEVSGLHIAEID